MFINIEEIKKLRLFSTEEKGAYIQTEEELQREIYVKYSEEFGLESDKVLKLKKLLYGLTKSGCYWSRTLSKRLVEGLRMSQCTLHTVVFHKLNFESLLGMRET